MHGIAKFLTSSLVLLIMALTTSTAHAGQSIERQITELRENIFRVQHGPYFSIYMVSDDGLLVADPIDRESAEWLRAELTERHGDLPIKYLIYSHNHPDHISGGEVLKEDGTIIIAHQRAAEDIIRSQVETAVPTLTFTDKLTIYLDERPIELAYYGPNNGLGNISLYVEDARFLFVVDWIVLKRLPWREMYYYDIDGMISSIRQALHLDFDLVAPGHHVTGDKDDVREYLTYLETLRTAVLDGMNQGKSLEQLQEEITLPQYSHYASFEWLPLNVKGVYDQLERQSARFGQDR